MISDSKYNAFEKQFQSRFKYFVRARRDYHISVRFWCNLFPEICKITCQNRKTTTKPAVWLSRIALWLRKQSDRIAELNRCAKECCIAVLRRSDSGLPFDQLCLLLFVHLNAIEQQLMDACTWSLTDVPVHTSGKNTKPLVLFKLVQTRSWSNECAFRKRNTKPVIALSCKL